MTTTNNTTDSNEQQDWKLDSAEIGNVLAAAQIAYRSRCPFEIDPATVIKICNELCDTRRASLAAVEEDALPPPTPPRCPKCGYVMCQQFDSRPVNAIADIATPNGKYICYYCTPAEPRQEGGTPVVAREFAREWMNTHHASFETNQEREDALAAIVTRYLVGTPLPETPVGGETPHQSGTVEQLDGSVATFWPPPKCVCDHLEHKETGECVTCGLFCGPVSNAVAREHLQAWSTAPVVAADHVEGEK